MALTGARELNGQQGLIVAEKGERWAVRFDDIAFGQKLLRPGNVRRLLPPAAAAASPPTPANPRPTNEREE